MRVLVLTGLGSAQTRDVVAAVAALGGARIGAALDAETTHVVTVCVPSSATHATNATNTNTTNATAATAATAAKGAHAANDTARLTKRTSKYMQGVAMRKWVVAVDWVTARLF